MTPQGIFILVILVVTVVLFATERLRLDYVALGVMIVLLLFGLVSPAEGVAGFTNPATITIAAMFVLSAGIQYTGVLDDLGDLILRFSRHNEQLLTLLLMVTVAVLSSFILNTAVVAVFIPLVLKIAKETDIAPSRLLIPVSFAAMLGGTTTLIGTSTNLLVNSLAQNAGLTPFRMLDFAPLGIIILIAGILYLLLVGRHLIPERSVAPELLDQYGLRKYLSEIEVLPDSTLVGKSLANAGLLQHYDVAVLDILREGRAIRLPTASRLIRANDILLVKASVTQLMALQEDMGLVISPAHKHWPNLWDKRKKLGLAEVVVSGKSSLIGYSLQELNFRQRFGVAAIGIRRGGMQLFSKLGYETLMAGDMLLVMGEKEALQQLPVGPDFLLLHSMDMPKRKRSSPWVVGIVLGVVISILLGWLPVMVSALLGAFLMISTGVLTLDEAYAAMDKRVLVMLGGVLSLEAAIQNSGLADWLANQILVRVGDSSPLVLIAVFYLLAMLLTESMSNQATAVVLTPLAISTAQALGANPTPFLMAITFAASASFMTPVGYQTNTMVYSSGNYRFFDFTRVGAPLNLLLWVISSLMIPLLWPLY
ncbi:MAG: SLC13 family permease [Chloroflexi bacterium]|nr:SLC13 family permease [Chloroflexota bacterium]